ncbi:unconventional myosin-IXb isoform X2 [Lampris incognitus]|uniref:unconventional myosin-IXb isoform X2 n=1 Tax=Lampris incognitus TaxID=2546036 RepID=UPI0024B4B5BC|nr:unconventional myosin-IXb isoform X2 [Lampris incognitus]
MSTMDGEGAASEDGRVCVLQIYSRLSQCTAPCCTLKVSTTDTTVMVIQNAVATMGLDVNQAYSLLEVRENGGEERALDAEECPMERFLLWPPEARNSHPQSQGYYFILQGGSSQVSNSGEDYDNLCNLPALTEDSILVALRQRFSKHKIYTYASGILIAVNPYKFLPMYYNPKYVKMYENQPLGKLSPHVFAMADVAYRAMLNKQVNQCIVISGESGSGKTESTSFLIHCLTALSQKLYCSGVERTILGAGPVLEAFGNAKTVQNNNCSRFGKFIRLNYLESGVVRGAVIEKYLLEKSRLVCRDKNERNYHVFYYLLMGASKEERKEFKLLQPQDYFYLKQEDFLLDKDEEKLRQEYKRLHQAMEMVGFLDATKKQVFSILSAILYLGNVTYTLTEEGQVLEVGPADVLSTLSDLLKVKKELLVEALAKKRAVTSSDTLILQYTSKEATTARDSMAKSLYSALFDWIVLHINHALLNRRDMEESVSCLWVGILDIFGFENFQSNGFEQFCINYANEKLQYYFNQHIFKLEQDEYLAEGITWNNINYTDNMGCIQLISKKPSGLFHLLDEESSLPQATDETLLDKFKQQHQGNPLFVPTTVMEPAFIIQHFAGMVKYQLKAFREKNTDHMRCESISLLRSSKRAFLRQLVGFSPVAVFRWGILRATIRILAAFKEMGRRRAESMAAKRNVRKSLRDTKTPSTVMQRLSSNSLTLDFSFDRSDEHPLDVFEDIFANYEKGKKNRGSRQKQLIPKNLMDSCSIKHIMGLTLHDRTTKAILHPHQRRKTPSISAQFQSSLTKLLETLEKAEPFFIRCIRSNAEKRKMHFDDELVLQQIRHMGLLETVRIQKLGYSARYTFKEFVKKFRMLLPKDAAAEPEEITKMLQKMGLDPTTYQTGKTKVFLKEKERQWLQDTHNKEVMRHIIILQHWFRCCLIRMHFLQKKDATMIIQRCWRHFYDKRRGQAATVIQMAWRISKEKPENLCQQNNDAKEMSGKHRRCQSLERRELKRQQGIEHSPSRSQQPDPVSDQDGVGDEQPGERTRDEGRQECRTSSPYLDRPLSVPLDSKAGRCAGSTSPSSSSPLHRYTNLDGIREKADRWKGRRSEGERTDDSSPERLCLRDKRAEGLQKKGKSMSVDELSKLSSSGSDSSPSTNENLQEPDGSRFSLPPKSTNESSGSRGANHPQPSTPERLSFLSKILKKRTPKESQTNESQNEKEAPLLTYSPHPYHTPNQSTGRTRRNPTIHISRATRARQWNASLEREITVTQELRNLDEFLGSQVNELRTRVKELSETETIFLTATMQFRDTIKSMYSVPKPQIAYKDLMKGYQNKVMSLAKPRQKTEVQLVVNLFRSVLDGFVRGEIKREEAEPVKSTKKTKKRRKKDKCPDGPLDHMFSTYQVNIMQSCDLCGSYIWGMEKAYMCSACKLICHKKCLTKVITDCSTRCARKDDSKPGSLHFGVHVWVLTSKANTVPMVVEMLLMHVEMNGLYTEGIYRKSGSACRARELHQILETDPEAACLENYPIHTITGLVKRWLRELPDPLMTFTLYNDFLHAVELPERSERMRALYQKLDALPSANYNTLERLIFHLVRVAKEEDHNRMSPSSLAIVFAPCILRSPDADDPFLGMKDVSKTTLCVEILINEQLRRYEEKMQNIQELEYAEALAVNELKLRRQNTVVESSLELNVPELKGYDNETETLIERIKSIKEEKDDLAYSLPELEQENSDNDNLDSESSMSSDSLLEDHIGSLDSEGKVAMRPQIQRPGCPPKPPDLALRIQSLMSQTNDGTVKSQSQCLDPSQDRPPSSPKPSNKPQLTCQSVNGSFDDLDIPFIDDDV